MPLRLEGLDFMFLLFVLITVSEFERMPKASILVLPVLNIIHT